MLKRKVKVQKDKNVELQQVADFTPIIGEPVQQNEVDQGEKNVVMQMIAEKKETLVIEKSKLSVLEKTIKKYCSEIEALEYIASGEPQMSIMNLLDMFQGFNDELEKYPSAEALLDEMEKTVLESTIQHQR